MDARPEVLAEHVRAKRAAIDRDLATLAARLHDAVRPDGSGWARTAVPIVAGASALVWWATHRNAVRSIDELLMHELAGLYATVSAGQELVHFGGHALVHSAPASEPSGSAQARQG